MVRFIIPVLVGIFLLSRQKVQAAPEVPIESALVFVPPTVNPPILRNDAAGQGHYGASRGNSEHGGIDLIAYKGQAVKSPIEGFVNRQLQVYSNDTKFIGCEIIGSGQYAAYKIKLFYMIPERVGFFVASGEYIGIMQAISEKYGHPMQDHIHIEVFKNNQRVDPTLLFFQNE